ncbi:multivesicular body subunit 12A isoform X2 [Accipiter gentilis]|uniref:multivesicular body subunit 12A isoform X2 n=1 Tax=Astur gentilis TaxID=8957 RepID=UPI00210FF62F|nr:multivesicular body subunit 12A isoform X2 [Accipiter gentilis]
MMAAETPLTGVAWAAAPEAAPAGWTAITVTVEGAAANLGKGFGHKGGGYLCVCTGGAQAAPGPVVTDLQVLSDRSPQPPGYTRIPEFPEARKYPLLAGGGLGGSGTAGAGPRFPPSRACRLLSFPFSTGTGFSRKKRVYMKLLPLDTAETAVFDLKLSSKSKALPHYMKIGEIGNFAIWCKKGPVLKSKVQPISEGLKQLSLQPPDSDHKSPVAQCSIKRASQHESLYDTSNIYGLSAMDGVPFTLHPKFESKLSSGSNAILADLNVKSLADIEKEYNYAFVVERTAAARLPPSVC